MKKILIFIDWFLPGYKAGGPISSNANMVEHLKDEFEFYIITRDTDYCENTPYPNITPTVWNILPNGARVYYITAKALRIQTLVKICKTISFDLVYINGIYSFYFSLFPLVYFKYFKPKKVIIAGRGMLSDHTFSSKKLKKQLFYTLAKLTGLYHGITFHATNDNEAEQIRKNVGFKGEVRIAPNLPPKITVPDKKTYPKKPGELRLISIARISPEKNTLFALQVLERLKAKGVRQEGEEEVSVTFDLYGTIYDESYWKECQAVIQQLPSHINVNYCGPLEKEKIQATIKQYHFLLMPSQGENYGHSIVESMLAGRPVIISDQTPWRNLENKVEVEGLAHGTLNQKTLCGSGWDISLNDPERFVDVIEYCIQIDQAEFDAMSEQTFLCAKQITENPAVLEANRLLLNH